MGNYKTSRNKKGSSYSAQFFLYNYNITFLIGSFFLPVLLVQSSKPINLISHLKETPTLIPWSSEKIVAKVSVKATSASCSDIKTDEAHSNKIHEIYPHGNRTSLEVLCDFETDGGGWTIIQKRTSGLQNNFDQNWTEYQNGFGSLNGNFWLGLENIHALTQNGDQELRIDLEDFEGNKAYAKYSNFSVSDASNFYRLSLDGFCKNSTAGDSMTGSNDKKWVLNGMRFSTKDKDNDNWALVNCAEDFQSGWWFNDCGPASNLNGIYREKEMTVAMATTTPSWKGITWYEWKDGGDFLAKTEMKIRRRK